MKCRDELIYCGNFPYHSLENVSFFSLSIRLNIMDVIPKVLTGNAYPEYLLINFLKKQDVHVDQYFTLP